MKIYKKCTQKYHIMFSTDLIFKQENRVDNQTCLQLDSGPYVTKYYYEASNLRLLILI